MEWLEEKLDPTEVIIFETRHHWSIFMLPVLLVASTFISLWSLLPGTALLGYELYIYQTHRFVVTNRRMIQKQGLYYIRIKDWPLFKIEDVICTRTLKDRLLGSGTVILMGMAFPKYRFKGIGYPFELRNAIYSQLPTK